MWRLLRNVGTYMSTCGTGECLGSPVVRVSAELVGVRVCWSSGGWHESGGVLPPTSCRWEEVLGSVLLGL